MFPPIDSTLRPDALVREVLPHYPIGEIARCRFFARGLNDTYKVETSEDQTYFLRIYRAGWRGPRQIRTELEVLLHVARHNANVSVPVARTDGETLTSLDCAEGERWAVLFTAAPGQEIEDRAFTEQQAGHYGEAAAALHRALDTYQGDSARDALDLLYLLERPLARVSSVISHRAADVSYVGTLADRLRTDVESAEGLEIGFCHGDLHARNAGYADGVFTFYDFDCCGWGYRAYDLSTFAWAFAVSGNAPERITAMARAFVDGYMRRRPLSEVDRAAIPAFVGIRHIWLIGLHVDLADRYGWSFLNDRYFDRQLGVLRDWEKNFLSEAGTDWLLANKQ